jgi:glycosyltransferase involved in cell wall biosynthesis
MSTLSKLPRIVFLEQYGSLGGGQQMLLELVAAARSLGCAVDILIPNGDVAVKLGHDNAAVVLIEECCLRQKNKTTFDIFRWFLYGIRLFAQNIAVLKKADLLYVNGARLLIVGILASLLLRKKVAYHIHLHHSTAEYRLFRTLLKFSLTRGIIVPSMFIRRQLPEKEQRVFTVENGLDARFSRIRYQDRFQDAPLRHVAIVGRISPEKGQDILLKLAPAFRDMTFHIFGDAAFADDAYYRELRQSVPPNVVFHGWIDGVAEKIDDLRVQLWIVPSRCAEASSLACMQGVAMSCLVAVREEGALAELADELGLSAFQSDEEMLRLLRHLLICHSGQLSGKTRAAFQKVMARYSHNELQKRLRKLLQRLLS